MKYSAKKPVGNTVVIALICCLFLTACGVTTGGSVASGSNGGTETPAPSDIDLNEIAAMPAVPIPETPDAPGEAVESNEHGIVDYSNTSDGYVMIKYTGEPTGGENDIKVSIVGPDSGKEPYRDVLPQDGEYHAFTLSDGSGQYIISLNKKKNTDPNDTVHLEILAFSMNANPANEQTTFLFPSLKVNYDEDSLSTKLAKKLSEGRTGVIAKTLSIYEYVIGNISYDESKAGSAEGGTLGWYNSDAETTLRTKKGICYDYAVLMTAMLRATDIPTKMVFGYVSPPESNPVYHAWIMVYSDETGWIDIIEFTGDSWVRMDPTFAASGNSKSIQRFIGDGSNYTNIKFLY